MRFWSKILIKDAVDVIPVIENLGCPVDNGCRVLFDELRDSKDLHPRTYLEFTVCCETLYQIAKDWILEYDPEAIISKDFPQVGK